MLTVILPPWGLCWKNQGQVLDLTPEPGPLMGVPARQ